MARADLRIHTEACCLSPWNKVILGYLRGKTKWINANLKTVTVHDKCNFPWKTSWFWNFKDPNQTVHDSLYHGDFTALEQLFCGQLVYWHSVMPGLFNKITQKTIIRNLKHANSEWGLSIQNLGTCMRRYDSRTEPSNHFGSGEKNASNTDRKWRHTTPNVLLIMWLCCVIFIGTNVICLSLESIYPEQVAGLTLAWSVMWVHQWYLIVEPYPL